ncbi:hypothetical protein DUNSADRAFT_17481 [Dunaliella salina]|uniref:S-methyl-5-thioribose kinase n=1 Tax=Dunaliella salina TaxID=3046 RepID=A0ABQ7G1N9_DUNSA|nr:hypothetical protein DUNSADRAFT_17481 [Dunaliella salina]|eukprot:KAF5828523.1 hypothetical protein DUNSADRAFT_17481 [Dunaliella salina]
MGAHGASALMAVAQARGRISNSSDKLCVLTHCNTGSLATSGYGTALGVIRALHEQGKLEHAYCTETRPYNQGARLTAFELMHDGLPATLVCDSAAAYLMASGKVDAVVVGADRVVATGDTANKIGTYMLAIVAAQHNVPFFVAAPVTTLDPALANGSQIVIEARPSEEITHFRGTRVVDERVQVWNPSFDVTPASLIAGIITEKGLVPKSGTHFEVAKFVRQHDSARAVPAPLPLADGVIPEEGSAAAEAAASGFYALDLETVKDYVAARPNLCKHVGPESSKATWGVREVGDGNINFVFIVEGPSGGVAIKQSLPYIRCVGESWPLTQDRMRLEGAALADEALHTPQHVPALYSYDATMALIVMQYIVPPAIILRKGLCPCVVVPGCGCPSVSMLGHVCPFIVVAGCVRPWRRRRVVEFTNPEMCELTEAVIFTEPYIPHPNNKHTSPQLDADVATLQADVEAKAAICDLKRKFHSKTDALLHGDLHTGSIMIDHTGVWMIDPEFAMYGPMGFDVGKFHANLMLMLFATHGHERTKLAQKQQYVEQREWLSKCLVDTWTGFEQKFLDLWNKHAAKEAQENTASPQVLAGGSAAQGMDVLRLYQATFMEDLWADTVRFAGAVMIRRLVGIAHVADMNTIEDADVRAGCERRALRFGRELLVHPSKFRDITSIRDMAVAAAAS